MARTPMPSVLALWSEVYAVLRKSAGAAARTLLVATAAIGVSAIAVLSIALHDVPFSEGGVANPAALGGIFALAILMFVLFFVYVTAVFLLSYGKPFTLRAFAYGSLTVFVWWLLTTFLPGFVLGFVGAFAGGIQDWLLNLISSLCTLVILSVTVLLPHDVFVQGSGIIRALRRSLTSMKQFFWPATLSLLLTSIIIVVLMVLAFTAMTLLLLPMAQSFEMLSVMLVLLVFVFLCCVMAWAMMLAVVSRAAATAVV